MRKLAYLSIVFIAAMAVIFVFGVHAAYADCPDGTPSDDNIDCDTDPPNPDTPVQGGSGNDVITVEPGSIIPEPGIDGDGTPDVNGGHDTIRNWGWVQGGIWGDYVPEANGGNDRIFNWGWVNWDIVGDGDAVYGGNDTIYNWGWVGQNLVGDQAQYGGNDRIFNWGWVGESIKGDQGIYGGHDFIVNNGFVNFDLVGDEVDIWGGNDIIINNGFVGNEREDTGGIIGDRAQYGGWDWIINNGTARFIAGDQGEYGGNDRIFNNGTVNDICGDGSMYGGDDYIENNGTVSNWINGDCSEGSTGRDTIVNNNWVMGIAGDGGDNTNGNDDFITNNGHVEDAICGDGLANGIGGNDHIYNYGFAYIQGDCAYQAGNDWIVNFGFAPRIDSDGAEIEEGDDYVANVGTVGNGGIWTAGGNDRVAIAAYSEVWGIIDGGWETTGDTLIGTTPEAIASGNAELVFSANCTTMPELCAGPYTVEFKGISYTFVNFESFEIWK